MARLRKLADWLEQEAPAANSLRERLDECFTINCLGIPPWSHRGLFTTNLIESLQSSVRTRTRRVCRWRDPAILARWAAASFLVTENNISRTKGTMSSRRKRSQEEKRWKLCSGRRSRNRIPMAALQPLTARDTIHWNPHRLNLHSRVCFSSE